METNYSIAMAKSLAYRLKSHIESRSDTTELMYLYVLIEPYLIYNIENFNGLWYPCNRSYHVIGCSSHEDDAIDGAIEERCFMDYPFLGIPENRIDFEFLRKEVPERHINTNKIRVSYPDMSVDIFSEYRFYLFGAESYYPHSVSGISRYIHIIENMFI